MSSRLLLSATLLLVVAAVPAAAQTLPCAGGQAADPCVITSPTTSIPTGTYDIRPRSLQIENRQIAITGFGDFTIQANNILLKPGARLTAPGIADDPLTPANESASANVTFEASGTFAMQSQGNTKSRIDTTSGDVGGDVTIHSAGDLAINGPIVANSTKQFGFGGSIDIWSTTGNVTIQGDASEGIKSIGDADGGGGSILVEATLGSITVSTPLAAKGGDCGGSCEVDLTAGVDVTTTAQATIDVNASGIGDGGDVSATTTGGDIHVAGSIFANGASDDLEGGSGGSIEFDSGGSISLGRVEMNGAGHDAGPDSENGPVDGDGGTVSLDALTTTQVTGPILAVAKGFGEGGELSIDSIGNVTISGEVDVSGDWFGGDVSIFSEQVVTVSARLRSFSIIDDTHFGFGGQIEITACQVNVTPTGQLIAIGQGGDPNGSTFIAASTGLTIAGTVTATDANDFEWRTSPPMIIGAGTVTPPPNLNQNLGLACCGVQCTTTTTTSTTTTTAATPTTTTSSTTLPGPTTSTTSSSTTTVVPTTTLGGSTTTAHSTTTLVTTTLVTTTTTHAASTTLATTTTTSSTVAPSTSSTSVVTPSTAAPTTTLPLTCLDTALGIDAVRCRLGFMSTAVGAASETELGGRKLAKGISKRVAKATTLTGEPASTKRFKKAAKQLKQLAKQLDKGLASGKLDATIGAELKTLTTEAQGELAGLIAG